MTLPSHDEVSALLSYDMATGVLRWRVSPRRNVPANRIAGMVNRQGYRIIKINGRGIGAHRIAWLLSTGVWPPSEIDHRNGNRDDNRIENLREATRSENNRNVGLRSDSTSGRKGVTWHHRQRKWCAQIQFAGRKIHLGSYALIEDAAAAYQAKAAELFGEFARARA